MSNSHSPRRRSRIGKRRSVYANSQSNGDVYGSTAAITGLGKPSLNFKGVNLQPFNDVGAGLALGSGSISSERTSIGGSGNIGTRPRRHSSMAILTGNGETNDMADGQAHLPPRFSDTESGDEVHVKLECLPMSLGSPTLTPPMTAPLSESGSGLMQRDIKSATYTSLPSSPLCPGSPRSPSPAVPYRRDPQTPQSPLYYDHEYYAPPFSLWDYLREELLATDFDSHQELKWERVSNFLSVPLAVEKVRTFGLRAFALADQVFGSGLFLF